MIENGLEKEQYRRRSRKGETGGGRVRTPSKPHGHEEISKKKHGTDKRIRQSPGTKKKTIN